MYQLHKYFLLTLYVKRLDYVILSLRFTVKKPHSCWVDNIMAMKKRQSSDWVFLDLSHLPPLGWQRNTQTQTIIPHSLVATWEELVKDSTMDVTETSAAFYWRARDLNAAAHNRCFTPHCVSNRRFSLQLLHVALYDSAFWKLWTQPLWPAAHLHNNNNWQPQRDDKWKEWMRSREHKLTDGKK